MHFGLQDEKLPTESPSGKPGKTKKIIEKKLTEKNTIEPADSGSKRKRTGTNEEDKNPQTKHQAVEKKVSAREKSLAKAAQGAKNIKSFFSAKKG